MQKRKEKLQPLLIWAQRSLFIRFGTELIVKSQCKPKRISRALSRAVSPPSPRVIHTLKLKPLRRFGSEIRYVVRQKVREKRKTVVEA